MITTEKVLRERIYKMGLTPKHSKKPLNITSILTNFKSLIKQVDQKGCTHKYNKKRIKIITSKQN